MSTPEKPGALVRAGADLPELVFHHPLNPRSEIHMRSLGDAAGLQRLGFHIARVPPGKESFIYHAQLGDEEFVYILSGRGIAEIDDREFEVGPGDFMGFPTPSVAHHLRNPFDADLVYLMGGERHPVEVADFPRLKKRLINAGGDFRIVSHDALEPFWK
jgi:uncharacterized cupin superfamily protein